MQELNELGAALAKAQGEIENATKNSNNPFFKSKYADLAECLNTVRPVFSANGLSIVQMPSFENGLVSVTTTLLHSSGQFLSGTSSAPLGGKGDVQAIGSTVTYLRRYSLAAFAGIAQEDDDGNFAKQAPQQRQEPQASKKEVVEIENLIDITETDKDKFMAYFQVGVIAALTSAQAKHALKILKGKIND